MSVLVSQKEHPSLDGLITEISTSLLEYVQSEIKHQGMGRQVAIESELVQSEDKCQRLQANLDEKTQHILLLNQQLEAVQEEMRAFKKVSYMQNLLTQIEEKTKEIEFLNQRYSKQQETYQSLRKTNEQLNAKIEQLLTQEGTAQQQQIAPLPSCEEPATPPPAFSSSPHPASPKRETQNTITKGETQKDSKVTREAKNAKNAQLEWKEQQLWVRQKKIKGAFYWVMDESYPERWIFTQTENKLLGAKVGKMIGKKKVKFFDKGSEN